jgi:hypothetical protein
MFNPDFILYLFFLLILISVTFSTGIFFSFFISPNKSFNFRVFFSLVLGYLFWVTTTAIFYTKGKTVLIFIPVIFIFWFYENLNYLKNQRIAFRELLPSVIVLIKELWLVGAFFLIFLVKHVISSGEVNYDYLYYSNLSFFLKITGIEGGNLSSLFQPEPYHYGDLWLNALVSTVFKTNHYHTIIFITVPYLLLVVYSGVVSLIEEIGLKFYGNIKLKLIYLYAGIIFIVAAYNYPFLDKFMEGTENLVQMPKLAIVFFIIILTMIFTIRDEIMNSFFSLILILSLYTPAAFFIWPGIGALILINLFTRDKRKIKYIAFFIIVSILTGMFYYWNSSTIKSSYQDFSDIVSGLKLFPEQLVKKTIRFLVTLVPYMILFVFVIYNRNLKYTYKKLVNSVFFKRIILFMASGFIFALLASVSLTYREADHGQLLYNGFAPAISVLSFMVIIFAIYTCKTRINNKTRINLVIVLFLIVFSLFGITLKNPGFFTNMNRYKVDEKFYSMLASKVHENDKIGFFHDFESTRWEKVWQYNFICLQPMQRYVNIRKDGVFFMECINVNVMDKTYKPRRYLYDNSQFIHYLDSLSKVNDTLSVNEIRRSYLIDKKFSYLVLPKEFALPDEIGIIVKDTLIRNDGLRIYGLNHYLKNDID